MAGYITHISRSFPEYCYDQKAIRETMKERVATNKLKRRIIQRIYSHSGIDTRYSVLGGFLSNGKAELYGEDRNEPARTAERNKLYEERARQLFVQTGRNILERHSMGPERITHLITISCTGFYAPGPDFDLIRSLGLNPEVERYHLGFMGCYAAISGLKLASRICSGDPDARVMVISTELCTLHFQEGNNTDDLISASVFADGSAGTMVTSDPPVEGPCLRLNGFASSITDHGADQMAWTIGNTGFRMVLSTYIPELLSEYVPDFLAPLFRRYAIEADQIKRWAIHPGGRLILDRVEEQLGLHPEDLRYSRKVLRENGNMSSVTTLAVLDEILRDDAGPDMTPEPVLALAFGPGLTIESGWMERIQHPETAD